MTSRLNPYISFRDNARQAMEYYRDVFGGNLALSTFGEFGDKDAPEANLIMHAMLETDRGFTLMGADTPPGMEFNPGTNMAVSVSGDDGDDLRGYWEKLGRRVRHVRRPVRSVLDGQHRPAAVAAAAAVVSAPAPPAPEAWGVRGPAHGPRAALRPWGQPPGGGVHTGATCAEAPDRLPCGVRDGPVALRAGG